MAFGTDICNSLILGSGPNSFPTSFGPMGMSWMMLTLMAVMVSLLIMTLVYMFANLLRNQGLITWTKFELFQVLASVVLFLAVWVMMLGACNWDMDFLNARYTGMNMYDIVENYFNTLKVMGYYLFACLMYVVKMINLLAKVTWLSNPLGLGMQDTPLESMGQINSIFFFVVGGFFTSMILLWLQMRMMDYMAYAAIFYLMPFGVFFRAFEPTRKFGGTLMGIAITFLLFYPMTIVFNDFIISQSINEEMTNDVPGMGLASTMSNIDGSLTPEGDSSVIVAKQLPSDYTQIRNEQPQTGDNSFENIAGIGASITNGTFLLLRPIMIYVIAAVFLPVINFIVLVEIARALTHLMGEEVDVSNLTRMI